MTEKKHSHLGASSAHRWINCPGSIKACENAPPQKESEYAKEGTAAHKLGEMCLSKKEHQLKANPEEYLGETIQGFVVDTGMVEAVGLYVDTVRKDQEEINGKLEVEKRMDLSSVFRGMFGTNDAVVYARWSKLIVYDYKHGQGHAVDVVDNPQLLYYALGAYLDLGPVFDFTEIELVIVQPRADHPDGPVRRWVISLEDLVQWSDRLREAAIATQQPDAPRKAGDHCRWCAAQATCPAAQQRVTDIAQADFTEPVEKTLKKPEELTPEQIKMVLDNAGFLDTWIKAVEEHAESQAKAGFPVPGYKLVQKRSTRQWRDEVEVVKELEPKFGKKIYSEPKVLSPAQMEKMIGKKEGGTIVVETLSHNPDTGVVLAPETDKRPAVAPAILTDFS